MRARDPITGGPLGTRTARPHADDGWHNATRRADDEQAQPYSEDLAQHHRTIHESRIEERR